MSRGQGTNFIAATALVAGALVMGCITPAVAQPAPPAGGAAGAQGQPGGGGRGSVVEGRYDDYTGFTKLWDGQTFKNWDGEMDVWSIEHDAIHADTIKTPGQHHIIYVGPGAVMRDFDLKVEMKMSATGANGGIQYRSRLLHPAHGGSMDNPLGKSLPAGVTTLQQAIAAGVTAVPEATANPGGGGGRGRGGFGAAAAPAVVPTCTAKVPSGGGGGAGRGAPGAGGAAAPGAGAGRAGAPGAPGAAAGRGGRGPQAPNPWQVSGYQYDMSSENNYTGQLYEGQGRSIVNSPGCMVILQPGRQYVRIGTVNEDPASAAHPYAGLDGEWNQLEIIARGSTLIHMMNGKVITVTVDDDPANRAYQGIMSLQLEGSGQIWYRNVYVKSLDKPMEFPKP